MPSVLQLTGKRFGRLTVIQREANDPRNSSMWRCRCDCGTELITMGSHLANGHTASCGCLMRERVSESITIHGQSMTKLHRVLRSMRMRCFNPNDPNYKHYGGRGISMCEAWKTDAMAFLEWAHANGYQEGLQIDRINNDGDYCPENCRFVDRFVQRNNCRTNRWHDYKGVSYTLVQLARITGLCAETIANRIDVQGMTVEQAVETPKMRNGGRKRRQVECIS